MNIARSLQPDSSMRILIELDEIPELRRLILTHLQSDEPIDVPILNLKVDNFIGELLEWLLDPDNLMEDSPFDDIDNMDEIKAVAETLIAKLVDLVSTTNIIKSIKVLTRSVTLIEYEETP